MKKCLIAAFLSTLALASPAMSDDSDISYQTFLSAYGFFMVHAENCDLTTRIAVTEAFLSDLAVRGVNAAAAEMDMRRAADLERPASGGSCRPEMARYWAEQAGAKHLNLLGALQ